MPTELFGALIDFKPPLSYIHPRRGAVTRLAKRGIEFLETPPLVAAIAATLSNGSKANPTQTLHQGGGRDGGEGLGNSHFLSFVEVCDVITAFFPRSNEKLNGAKGTKRDKPLGQKWRNLRNFNHRRHTQGHGLSNHSWGTIHYLQNLTKQSTRAIYKILGYWMKIRYHKNLLLSYNSFVVLKLCLSEGSVLSGMNSQRLLRMKALTMSLETSVFYYQGLLNQIFPKGSSGPKPSTRKKKSLSTRRGLYSNSHLVTSL